MEKKKRILAIAIAVCLLCALLTGIVGAAAGHLAGLIKDSDLLDYYSDKNKQASQIVILPTGTATGIDVSDVSALAANVMPAMVSIECSIVKSYTEFFGRTYEQEETTAGSGILIAQKNEILYIATNAHVIDGAEEITVFFTDGSSTAAEVKGSDVNADLAVITVNMKNLSSSTKSYIRIAALGDSTTLKAGDFVVAIGNALGSGQSVTVGYISATERDVTIDEIRRTLLQTDAAINPGNSGGALVNANGQVIGISSAKYSSESVEGTGYAIPISDAVPILTELMNREVISKKEAGFLGISGVTVTSSYSQRFGIPVGVYVSSVKKGSPADKAGISEGDVIISYNGVAISTNEDLTTLLDCTRAGTTVTIGVAYLDHNEYVEKEIEVTLGNR